jgi:catechol 2,3-dioxygenase-like lactoylglutathione lyase family enzyme
MLRLAAKAGTVEPNGSGVPASRRVGRRRHCRTGVTSHLGRSRPETSSLMLFRTGPQGHPILNAPASSQSGECRMISRLDHFVLTVRSIEATCAFYNRALGFEVVTFGQGRKALAFGQQKINLHEVGNEFDPKALNPTPGSSDFCLVTDTPVDEVCDRLRSLNIVVEDGPVARTGATGPILSIYFRDPDGNLVEVSNYLS